VACLPEAASGNAALSRRVFFVPVDVVDHFDLIRAVVEHDILNEFRGLPMAADSNHRAERVALY
jgi:hypothetical protein